MTRQDQTMLPPTEINLLMLDGMPIQAKPSALPGLVGTFLGAYAVAAWMRPRWSAPGKVLLAVVLTNFMQIAYVIHDVGHIRSARQVNAPMNAVVLDWMFHSNHYLDTQVTPRQHVGRASGGLIASALSTWVAVFIFGIVRRIPLIGALAEGWVVANGIVLAVSAVPTQHFDGGSILKWTVTGATGEEALGDEALQTAGALTIGALLVGGGWAALRGQWRASLALWVGALAAGLDLFWLKGRLP